MEDADISELGIDEDTHLFGVFDGHGGKEVSKFVKQFYVDELLKNENYKAGNYVEALKESFLRMDEMLVDKNERGDGYEGAGSETVYAGCTANVCLIVKDTLYCANAGDSRSVLSNNGKAQELSEDHKPDDKQELDRIRKAGG